MGPTQPGFGETESVYITPKRRNCPMNQELPAPAPKEIGEVSLTRALSNDEIYSIALGPSTAPG